MSTFNIFIESKKVRNKDCYKLNVICRVDGKKVVYNIKDKLSNLNNRILETVINYVSDVEGLDLNEKIWELRKHHESNLINLLSGKKAFRYTRKLYHGDYIYDSMCIDDLIKVNKGSI